MRQVDLVCCGYLVKSVYLVFRLYLVTLVFILFSAMRERLTVADVPEPFKGAAIAMITAGLMSLAFMGFGGLA